MWLAFWLYSQGLLLGSHTGITFVAVVEDVNFLQFLDCYPKLMGKYYQSTLSHWQAWCKDINKILQRLWWLSCVSTTSLSVKLKLASFRTKGKFPLLALTFPVLSGCFLSSMHRPSIWWKHCVNGGMCIVTWIVTWFVDKTRQNCAWRNKYF